MSLPLHFPSAEEMIAYLSAHSSLKMDYFVEKGVAKAITELAAKRFANSDKVEMRIKMDTMLIINDLQAGEDRFTGEALPNLGKIGLSPTVWTQIAIGTEKALIDCANKKTADQKNADIQFNLGVCYEEGQGVPQDLVKAVDCYKKAADQGDAFAQCNLGVCYEEGRGVSRDLAKAVDWYKKAADQGDAFAQCNLGVCYEEGQGTPQDLTKAIDCYKKAADQGVFRSLKSKVNRPKNLVQVCRN